MATQVDEKHTSLRKKIEEAVARELYDNEPRMLTKPESADVRRFVDTNVMGFVNAYILRNYERVTDEDGVKL